MWARRWWCRHEGGAAWRRAGAWHGLCWHLARCYAVPCFTCCKSSKSHGVVLSSGTMQVCGYGPVLKAWCLAAQQRVAAHLCDL